MRYSRLAEWAAGAALFYGSSTGVCQSIPTQPGGGPAAADRSPAPLGASLKKAHLSLKFYATYANKNGLTPQACQQVLTVLLPLIQAYPHPNDWTWFVACDEPAWTLIQLHQDHLVSSGILAITNRKEHATIIRGSAMLHPYNNDFRAQPEHIIAHELCHIYLQSSDESKVDALATQWVTERNARHLARLSR